MPISVSKKIVVSGVAAAVVAVGLAGYSISFTKNSSKADVVTTTPQPSPSESPIATPTSTTTPAATPASTPKPMGAFTPGGTTYAPPAVTPSPSPVVSDPETPRTVVKRLHIYCKDISVDPYDMFLAVEVRYSDGTSRLELPDGSVTTRRCEVGQGTW